MISRLNFQITSFIIKSKILFQCSKIISWMWIVSNDKFDALNWYDFLNINDYVVKNFHLFLIFDQFDFVILTLHFIQFDVFRDHFAGDIQFRFNRKLQKNWFYEYFRINEISNVIINRFDLYKEISNISIDRFDQYYFFDYRWRHLCEEMRDLLNIQKFLTNCGDLIICDNHSKISWFKYNLSSS